MTRNISFLISIDHRGIANQLPQDIPTALPFYASAHLSVKLGM